MIYFIHDETSHSIKIGCAIDPRQRLSQLQISTSNKLILLGTIAGTRRTEKKVHDLVRQHCAAKPGESFDRPLCRNGEWFDDRILPFVRELMQSPEQFLGEDKKPARPRNTDASLRACKLVLEFDSGEVYHEQFVLKAGSPELALAALAAIAQARLPFLAHTARVAQLVVPGCTTSKPTLQGGFVTQRCEPRDGLSIIFNSQPGNGYGTVGGVKQYSIRWLHGVPDELWDTTHPWSTLPTAQCSALLNQFAQVLERHQCVVSASLPLPLRGLIPRERCRLPKGELRSKVNKRAAARRRQPRSPEETARRQNGSVYFIQDFVTLDIKIGFCLKDPQKRLAALQTGNANQLRLLGHIAGSILDEKLLHARFAGFRISGEWFSPAITEEIASILQHHSLEEWLQTQDSAPVPPHPTVADAGLDDQT